MHGRGEGRGVRGEEPPPLSTSLPTKALLLHSHLMVGFSFSWPSFSWLACLRHDHHLRVVGRGGGEDTTTFDSPHSLTQSQTHSLTQSPPQQSYIREGAW